jgi:cytochrome c peroxidase
MENHMFRKFLLIVSALLIVTVASATDPTPAQHTRTCAGESCEAVVRGLFSFFDRSLHGLDGNGRSCADCHMPSDQFQLSPAGAEARFQLLQKRRRWNPWADDPLFRPIDADDFHVNGDQARDFRNLRENGLVRVEFTLPVNLRLIDPATNLPSAETRVDIWRMVPTVNDVKLTGSDGMNPWARAPNATGGYQLDGRFADLEEQALGALLAHAQIQAPPPPRMLEDLAAFQRTLFTNHRVRALSDAVSAGASLLPDPDPPLSGLEQSGKAVFARSCGHCHGGPGQSTTQAPVVARYHDIATQCPRPVDTAAPARFNFKPCPERLARNTRTYEITLPNGATVRRVSSDPGRALLTGFVGGPPPLDDWNKLDVNGLRGIRHTAPFFHNNSAASLEEVVEHYVEFFKRVRANAAPGTVPPVASTDGINFDRQPQPEEIEALLAYLKKL